ncbi:hypothetical protein XENORESO_008912 [Xenotaenia resolanae]|uniref:Transmembrane protein n=1 Tax=Xenotaenia resolanae TaxID=208358 RepID=A0ABV0WAP2_9TELE
MPVPQSATSGDCCFYTFEDAKKGGALCMTEQGSYPASLPGKTAACFSHHYISALSSMDGTKGEHRQAEQAASLFGTSELESQRISAEQKKKRSHLCKIITGIVLLCLLLILLAVLISVRNGGRSTGKL